MKADKIITKVKRATFCNSV